MFLSKLWSVSERIPPFLLFSTLIHEIVQTLGTDRQSDYDMG